MSLKEKIGTWLEDNVLLGFIFGTLAVVVIPLLLITGFRTIVGSENYSNGERIGFVTQLSKTAIIWKSWEGHLN